MVSLKIEWKWGARHSNLCSLHLLCSVIVLLMCVCVCSCMCRYMCVYGGVPVDDRGHEWLLSDFFAFSFCFGDRVSRWFGDEGRIHLSLSACPMPGLQQCASMPEFLNVHSRKQTQVLMLKKQGLYCLSCLPDWLIFYYKYLLIKMFVIILNYL